MKLTPRILKTFLLNAGFEAGFMGYKTSNKMKKKYNCNIPWIILMDPTTACNLHCTGCWAAEYGNKLNLSYETMDKIITEGKELGIYAYLFTGGEPLIRKDDIIRLCEKHKDVAFHAFTNGTLIDEKFCQDLSESATSLFPSALKDSKKVTTAEEEQDITTRHLQRWI